MDELNLFSADEIIDDLIKESPETIMAEPEQDRQREKLINWIQTNPDVLIIIAFSGGKDSIAMVLYYLYELKVPKERIELWHHMVDGEGEQLFDWMVTTQYCQKFADAFGLKLLFSYRKGGIVQRLLRDNEPKGDIYYQREPGGEYYLISSDHTALNTAGKWPEVGTNMTKRWCSSEVKIEVASGIFANDPRFEGTREKPIQVVFNTGERRVESRARRKYDEIVIYKKKLGEKFLQKRHVIQWRCIIDLSHEAVWKMMEAYKIQPHPCYVLGWNRCSCQLCIFNKEDYWATLLLISPEKVARIRELEMELASPRFPKNKGEEFLLYHKKNIYEMAVAGQPFVDLSDEETQYWIKQATVEFTHDIIIEDWKMPAGALRIGDCGAT